jgi:hypothetical protein
VGIGLVISQRQNHGIGEKIIKITFIKIIFIVWEVSYLYFVLPEFDEELYALNNQGLRQNSASLDYII